MLNPWVPWIALALAVFAVVAGRNRATQEPESKKLGMAAHMAGGLCLALGIALAIAGFSQQNIQPSAWHAGLGALMGLAFAALLGFVGSRFDSVHQNRLGPAALGLAAMGLTLLFPPEFRPALPLGAVLGMGAGAWILAFTPTHWPSVATLSASAALAVNALGQYSGGDTLSGAGVLLGAGVVLAMLVAHFVFPPKDGHGPQPLSLLVGGVAAAAAVWLLASNAMGQPTLAQAAVAGVAVGLVSVWLVPKESNDDHLGLAITFVTGLGLATFAFGVGKGFGMAGALLGAWLVTLIAGNGRAAAGLAPLAGLVVYRLMREMHPDASKALDIGQHYGLVGLMVGLSIPLLAMAWFKRQGESEPRKTAMGALLWAIVLLVIPVAGAIVLGAKGYVGLMAGVGIGGAVAALAGYASEKSLALAMSLSAGLAVQYAWLQTRLDLTRDEKVQALGLSAAILVILGLAIAALSRRGSVNVSETKG